MKTLSGRYSYYPIQTIINLDGNCKVLAVRTAGRNEASRSTRSRATARFTNHLPSAELQTPCDGWLSNEEEAQYRSGLRKFTIIRRYHVRVEQIPDDDTRHHVLDGCYFRDPLAARSTFGFAQSSIIPLTNLSNSS